MSEVVELFEGAEGRWRWRYRTDDLALESNETYESADEARQAARIAYPGVTISSREAEAPEDSERSNAIGWLALLLVIVVLLRSRKAR
jgi:hypothetical protein